MAAAEDLVAGRDRFRLFLGGDVMLGRGVDQILPHPGDPRLWERYVTEAGGYVDLAVAANGPFPLPVGWNWPWGEALPLLDDAGCDARVINLETSITTSDAVERHKGVHYRMSPENLPALTAARPDVTVLANNHVLDFGRTGLLETLDVLTGAGLIRAGAGRSLAEAEAPAVVPMGPTGGSLLVFAFGTVSSGIPTGWAADVSRPGVNLITSLTDAEADRLCARAQRSRRPGDLVVASVHWGSNWGYAVDPDHVRFAHRLIDGGFDLVHGHSSHHPRPLEVYRDRLIIYGCGDLVDDYEGITGHEEYRDDLRLLYLATLARPSGLLLELRMHALQARRMRLQRASIEDADWLRQVLDEVSRSFGTAVDRRPDGSLALVLPGSSMDAS